MFGTLDLLRRPKADEFNITTAGALGEVLRQHDLCVLIIRHFRPLQASWSLGVIFPSELLSSLALTTAIHHLQFPCSKIFF